MEMKEYILYEFGEKQGQSLITDITKKCISLKKLCIGENKANRRIMSREIFPRVAMYYALQKIMSKKEAYDKVWDYTKTCICTPARQQYRKLERIPFFFFLLRNMFLHTMLHSSAWSAQVTRNAQGQFGFAVHRCLWKDTCLTCGCPELCRIFCDSDKEIYGKLSKVRFSRTQTLGTGGMICDFTFCKVHPGSEKTNL